MNILLNLLLTLFLIMAANAQATEQAEDQKIHLYPREENYLSNIQKISPEGEFHSGLLSYDSEFLFLQGSIAVQNIFEQVWMKRRSQNSTQLISSGIGYASDPVYDKRKNRIIFSSTEGWDPTIPALMPMLPDELWQLREFDLYSFGIDGTGVIERLTDTQGYDSEAAVSPDGSTIVFTSFRKGDVDIYSMKIQSGEVNRLTNTYGLDCQPCFSPDGQWIIFSSFIPETEIQQETYSRMLETKYVNMANFEIYAMNIDGSARRPLTDFGAVSINPCMHPSADQIVFSSNYDPVIVTAEVNSPNFELFVTDLQGSFVKQVTYNQEFDGYPSFNKTGSEIIFTSSRGSEISDQRSIYSADWKAYNPSTSTEE